MALTDVVTFFTYLSAVAGLATLMVVLVLISVEMVRDNREEERREDEFRRLSH